ncbi:MAG: DUF4249 domain-containing protein [Bacteroidota bacterium]
MKTIKYIVLFLTVVITSSCEKVIDVDLNDSDQQLVIEGVVQDDVHPATVKITRSLNFSQANNFPSVNDATVIISDDAGNTDTLPLVSPGVYQSDSVLPLSGRTYYLTVQTGGKLYTSKSQMPFLVEFDSLGMDSLSFAGATNYSIIPYHYDPAGVKNCYRYKLFVNGQADKNILVDNDDYTDGKNVSRPLFTDQEMEPGDNITVEMFNIDAAVYLYYFSLSQSGAGPDESATPANPVSNINGGSLGYFSAQTKKTKSIIIP